MVDAIGNVIARLPGSGAHLLMVAAMDEIGYVVVLERLPARVVTRA